MLLDLSPSLKVYLVTGGITASCDISLSDQFSAFRVDVRNRKLGSEAGVSVFIIAS